MLKLAGIFKDNMVVQRNKPVIVWGTGTAGKTVTVSLHTSETDTVVSSDGFWKVSLKPLHSGDDYILKVSDTKDTVLIKNVAVGEVWLAGGQSNMELALRDSENGVQACEKYSGKNIRFYQVPKCPVLNDEQKEQEEKSTWNIADSQNVGEMSAVAFYFAERLSEKLDCIVGIIDCYWGGTSVSCWFSREMLEKLESGKKLIAEYAEKVGDKSANQYELEMNEYNKQYNNWLQNTEKVKKENPSASWKEIHNLCGDCPWPQPSGWQSPFRPNGLYESMIKRIVPYSLKGFIYYQGEEDVQRYESYCDMMYMLVRQWRTDWNDWNLPFLFVQLPMYIADGETDDRKWAMQREQQYMASMMIQNSAMISLADCGEYDNIHPVDKKTPAERLSMLAESMVYGNGKTITPTVSGIYSENSRLYISFDNLDDELTIRCTNSFPFEIAGKDGKFYNAETVVFNGSMLCAESPEVKYPCCIRYAWYNFGEASLFTKSGYPVPPFSESI